jgi:hypothetical protein
MRNKTWAIAAALLLLAALGWLVVQRPEPAIEPVATGADASDTPPTIAGESAPATAAPEPSAPASQPSAANAPAPSAAPDEAAPNTPRKRPAEAMRLHFAHKPEQPTPGIGLSQAACAELRDRQRGSEPLSERERLHLMMDCRGR